MLSPSSQLLQKCLKGLKEEAGRGTGPFPKTRVICFLLISIAPFCPVPPLSQTPRIRLLLHDLINFSQFWDSKSSSPFHRWGLRSSQSLVASTICLYTPQAPTQIGVWCVLQKHLGNSRMPGNADCCLDLRALPHLPSQRKNVQWLRLLHRLPDTRPIVCCPSPRR